MLTGHLLAVAPYVDKLPSDAHGFLVFGQMARDYPGKMYYLDMWPFIGPLLVCTSATAAIQVSQKTALAAKKPESLHDWFLPIAGGPNLFSMQEEEWRPWRNIFNPGFSAAYLLTLVPDIVRETLAYREVLKECAEAGTMFQLDEVTLWFTMDLIGAIVLDAHLDSKKTQNPLATALLSQLQWKLYGQELNPFELFNPIRPVVHWYNGRQMDKYIGKELDKRYEDYRSSFGREDNNKSKSVISLVIQGYMEENRAQKLPATLDKTFRAYATSQIRVFLFAGHDTTSSTICHIYYLLSKDPEAMKNLRAEHDSILGMDFTTAGSVISEQPQVLNRLMYTLAVIKEAMRLFPPASSIRTGVEGVDITDDAGNLYPTGGCAVWTLHQAIQRDPAYWKHPTDFIPERWLVGPEHPLYPVKGAWRPFEHGPRNCIGQGLVLMELKVILALTVREFDVRDAYKEWDELYPRKGIKTVEGERAYQIEKGGAHPADRFPCRVSSRK
ncbi:hypothetical protein MMC15_008436 [Xylographa vitiligo]|nr:hypothetical protein [Xylographa vitiligo]